MDPSVEKIIEAYGAQLNSSVRLHEDALIATVEYMERNLPFLEKKVRLERQVFQNEEKWIPFLKRLIQNLESYVFGIDNSKLIREVYSFKKIIEALISPPLNSHSKRKKAIQTACSNETYDEALLGKILNHENTSTKTIKLGLETAMNTKNLIALDFIIEHLSLIFLEADEEEEETDEEMEEKEKIKYREIERKNREAEEAKREKAAMEFVCKYMNYCYRHARDTYNFKVMLHLIEKEQEDSLIEEALKLFNGTIVQLTENSRYHLLVAMENDMPVVFEALAKQLAEEEDGDGMVFLKKFEMYLTHCSKGIYEKYAEILMKLTN